MPIAQGHGELVRHLEAQGARLSEANVMRLSRAAAADEAGLAGNEGKVGLIADALFLREGQLTGASSGFEPSL